MTDQTDRDGAEVQRLLPSSQEMLVLADAGRAVAASIGSPAGAYNVCEDDPMPLCEYLATVIAAAGGAQPLRVPAFFGSWLFGDVWRYFSRSLRVTNAKLKATSGWQPAVRSVREGWPLVARGPVSQRAVR